MKQFICVLLLAGAVAAQTSTADAKRQLMWQKLETSINEVDRNLDGVMGVAILDLSDHRQLLLHADEVFPTASSIKIAVLAELYRQAQAGKLKLTDIYTVQASDLVQDSDIMNGLTPGVTKVTLRDLATMMISVSDNSAANVLIDRVGMENVNAMLDSLGLKQIRLRRKMMDLNAAQAGRENIATPHEFVNFLAALYEGRVLNKDMTGDFFRMLTTHKQNWISHPLPEGLKVADKNGELEGVRNDSGIFFVENRPYAVSVMTGYLRNERDGEEAIIRVILDTYQMFDRLGRASEYGRVISTSNGNK